MVRQRSFVSISAAAVMAAMMFSIDPPDLDAAPLAVPKGSETSVDWKGFLVGCKTDPGKQAQGLALCPFNDTGELEQARILIDSDFSLVDRHYNFQVFPTPDETSAKYRIKVVRTRQSEAEAEMPPPLPADFQTKPVGELEVRGGHLYLLPTPLSATRIGAQLCNARVVVNQGGALQLVRLRETLKKPPVALSLVEDDTVIDFPTAPLPTVGNAYLVVKGVSGPDLQFFPDGDQRIPLEGRTSYQTKGEITIIVEIAFRMNDKLCHCVRIKPYYQIGKERRKAFVASEVMKAGASAERAIANAQQQLAAAQSALPDIESELNSLGADSGGDDQTQAERVARIEYLMRLHRKAISTISRFKRSLPRSQASLIQLQRVRELGQSIHKKIIVEFSVEVENNGARLVLAEYLVAP